MVDKEITSVAKTTGIRNIMIDGDSRTLDLGSIAPDRVPGHCRPGQHSTMFDVKTGSIINTKVNIWSRLYLSCREKEKPLRTRRLAAV